MNLRFEYRDFSFQNTERQSSLPILLADTGPHVVAYTLWLRGSLSHHVLLTCQNQLPEM